MDSQPRFSVSWPPAVILASTAKSGSANMCALDGRGPGDLHDAITILADEMHEAVTARRAVQPGTEAFRRADERVACLVDLFLQIQEQRTIPDQVWRLGLGSVD